MAVKKHDFGLVERTTVSGDDTHGALRAIMAEWNRNPSRIGRAVEAANTVLSDAKTDAEIRRIANSIVRTAAIIETADRATAIDLAVSLGRESMLIDTWWANRRVLEAKAVARGRSNGGKQRAENNPCTLDIEGVFEALESARAKRAMLSDTALLADIAQRFPYGERGHERHYRPETLLRMLRNAGYPVGRKKKTGRN